jgi:uncharacterized membrane protein
VLYTLLSTMTETTHSPRIGARSQFVGLWALGSLLYVALIVAGLPLVAVAAFAVAGGAAVALQGTADRPVFDERDEQFLEEASANAVRVLGIGSAVVFPTMVILRALDYVEWPAWFVGFAWFVAGFFALWTAFLLLARYRR